MRPMVFAHDRPGYLVREYGPYNRVVYLRTADSFILTFRGENVP